MAEEEKINRREFFKGMAQKMKLREWREGDISGVHPTLRKADNSLKAGDYSQAQKYYEKFLQEEPRHLEALRLAGYCCFRLQDIDTAREYWTSVEEIRPKDNFCSLYNGLAHARQGSMEKALECWRTYFNIHKPHIQREINVTLALAENGEDLDPQEVADSIEEAINRQKKGKSE